MRAWNQASRAYAEEHSIPHRKAELWFGSYDFEQRVEYLQTLPEYDVIEIEAGGIIAVEDKYG